MRIAAAYIRVSTADQTEYSPESQLRLIKEYAKKHELIIPEKYIFSDEGISGRKADKRPAFQEMIRLAKQRPQNFDVILVYSTSRFARNHEESVVYRSMLAKQCGVELISITQPNVDRKTDMLTSAIYGIMDEWYSLDLSENVKRGMTQKAMEGGTQTAPPLGYDLKQKGAAFTVNEEEAKHIVYIFEEFLKGSSKWKIARKIEQLGARSKRGRKITTRNIDYILRNVTYTGYSRWTPTGRVYNDFKHPDTIIAKSKHPAIISDELFALVQKKLDEQEVARVKNERPLETKKHWLSGLIKCDVCGSSLNYNGPCKTRKHPCFRCGAYGKGACREMSFITVKRAEELVLSYLNEIFNDIDILYAANIRSAEGSFSEIKHLNDELKKQSRKLERAKLAFMDEVFDLEEYKTIKSSVDAESEHIRQCLSEIQQPISYLDLHNEIKNVYQILINESFGKDAKHKAIKSIVESIMFNKKSGLFQINFYS